MKKLSLVDFYFIDIFRKKISVNFYAILFNVDPNKNTTEDCVMHKTISRPKSYAHVKRTNGAHAYLNPIPKNLTRFAKRKPIQSLGIGLGSLALCLLGYAVYKKTTKKNIWRTF